MRVLAGYVAGVISSIAVLLAFLTWLESTAPAAERFRSWSDR